MTQVNGVKDDLTKEIQTLKDGKKLDQERVEEVQKVQTTQQVSIDEIHDENTVLKLKVNQLAGAME